MFKFLSSMLEKPPIYAASEAPFWDDEHISAQMLKAHLDPDFEGASRKMDFIDRSVAWIQGIVPPENFPLLLDMGCGPGIYAEKFARAGYQVTGIDFSRRSIRYAEKLATAKNLKIRYLCENYLNMNLAAEFDFAVMIYCDYGVLPKKDRQTVLEAVRRHLRPGGWFLLDVFTTVTYDGFEEKQTWEIHKDGGFWSKEPYIALNGDYKYPDNVTLRQTSVVSPGGITTYYLWDTCFTQDALEREVKAAGFKVKGVFSDAAGEVYHSESPSMAMLLERI